MRTTVPGPLLAVIALALIGCPAKTLQPEPAPPAPSILAFTATPNQVAPEEGVTLAWKVEHATSVTIVHLGHGPLDGFDPALAEGSVSVQVSEDALFVLTARGPGGSDSLTAGVGVEGHASKEVVFAAFPPEIEAGASTTLAWTAPGAAQVTLTGPGGEQLGIGGQLTAGAIEVSPSTASTYTLRVDGREYQTQVVVKPAIHLFVADRGAVTQNQKVILSWRTAGAEQLTLSRAGAGVLLTELEAGAVAEGSFEDTVPEQLPNDGIIFYELTVTLGDASVTRKLVLYVGVAPRLVAFNVPLAVLANAGFIVSWTTEQADSVELLLDGALIYRATTAAQVRQGAFSVPAPEDFVLVEIRLTNLRGGEAGETRLVEVIGPVSFVSFEPDTAVVAQGGEPVTLSWNVTNARNVRIEADARQIAHLTGPAAEAGSVLHYPNGPVRYTLHADNTVGSAIIPAERNVTVTNPARLTYAPTPTPAGASVSVLGHTAVNGGGIFGLPVIEKNASGASFVDISESGTPVTFSSGTIATALFPLSQPFRTLIYGVPVTAASLAINKLGFAVFADATKTAATANLPFPNIGLHPLAISPYWKHQVFQAESEILVQEDGPVSNRRIIIQWEKMEQSGVTGSQLTYQAQIYADGRIVFAYKTLQGLTAPAGSVGVVNRDESEVLFPSDTPAAGDTYTFFGEATLPFATVASPQPYVASIPVGNPVGAHRMEIEGRPEVIPPRQIYISEVHFHPASGAPAGEWLELTNPDNVPFDLDGWVIEFGIGGPTHQIVGPLTFPASGVLVLGQAVDAAVNGGAPVDYAYGTGFSMPDTSGRLSLYRHGALYSYIDWDVAISGGEGISVRADPPNPDLLYAPGVQQLTCGSTATYGPLAQIGTPGIRDPRCFPYELEFDPIGDFQSLAQTGQQLTLGNLAETIVRLDANSVPALTHPVKWGYGTYDTLYVSTNAWVAPRDASEPPLVCPSATDCYKTQKNRTSFNPATVPNRLLALYWSNTAVQAGGGIYIERKDPDPTVVGDEYTVVSFENMRWGATGTVYDMNWQVKFFENGDIEYHFGSMYAALNCTTNCGSSSTTWMESEDGNAALVVNISSSSNPGIRSDTAWKFKFRP